MGAWELRPGNIISIDPKRDLFWACISQPAAIKRYNFNAFTQEFAYRDEFFTPIEQLQQITGNNGKVLALSGLKNPYPGAELGVIKEGAFADIIIVNGDPTKDIRLLMDAAKNIGLIMKDGKIYKNTLN